MKVRSGYRAVQIRTMISTSAGKEVGYQRPRLGNPLLVARLCLEGAEVRHVLIVVRRVTANDARHRACHTLTVCSKIRLSVGVPVGLLDGRHGAIAIGQCLFSQAARNVGGTDEPGTAGDTGGWGSRDALKGVVLLAALGTSLEERCTGFLVREVGLPRVGEEGQDGRDPAS